MRRSQRIKLLNNYKNGTANLAELIQIFPVACFMQEFCRPDVFHPLSNLEPCTLADVEKKSETHIIFLHIVLHSREEREAYEQKKREMRAQSSNFAKIYARSASSGSVFYNIWMELPKD